MKNIVIGLHGIFDLSRVKNENGSWLAETWSTLEDLCAKECWMIGVYNGFDLVVWALNSGLITRDECQKLYCLLLDSSVDPSTINWNFVSPVFMRHRV